MSLLQQVVQTMHAYELPIYVAVGLGGFALTCVGDYIRNRYKRRQIEASAHTAIDEETPILPPDPRNLYLSLNTAGLIMLAASFMALLLGGYFEQYIRIFFGR